MRSIVEDFAMSMESKLAQHDEARGDSWRKENIEWLLQRLREEVVELEDAFKRCAPRSVRKEAVDVANFAMFVFFRAAEGERE